MTDRAAQVIEDFCLALRDATMFDGAGASDERKASLVRTVQILHRALVEGGFDPMPRVRQLAQESGWDMVEFLDQCLRFPAVVPMIREKNGIRKSLRCSGCRQRERPEDDHRFFVCEKCLEFMQRSVTEPTPGPGLLLFRTSTPEARCSHADDETFLIVYPWYPDYDCVPRGFCARCLSEELQSRHTSRPSQREQ